MRTDSLSGRGVVSISPLLDVLMLALGAIIVLLIVYVYLMRSSGPPIFILSEEDPVYRFESGSAALSEEFREAFVREFLPALQRSMLRYQCDVIEVVGHTDGQPVGQRMSNLDGLLVPAVQEGQWGGLRPGSNVDLGMMRALAVIDMLNDLQGEGYLSDITLFHPYSAGQVVLPDRTLAVENDVAPDPARRRIEIRILRSTNPGVASAIR